MSRQRVTIFVPEGYRDADEFLSDCSFERPASSFDPDIHVPGLWRCAKCNFVLVQSSLSAVDGTIAARDEAGDKCPNDGAPLWRVTWKDHANEMAERCEQAITDSRAAVSDAYESAAKTFEIYASDQVASKRWQDKSGKRECDIRAEIWNDAASELRRAAAK